MAVPPSIAVLVSSHAPGWSGRGRRDRRLKFYELRDILALGDGSWDGDGRPLRERPLLVFAYTDGREDLRSWIWRDERIIKLPTDPAAAARQLAAALSA